MIWVVIWVMVALALASALSILVAVQSWAVYDRTSAWLYLCVAIALGSFLYPIYLGAKEGQLKSIVINALKIEEGFRGDPYSDTLGFSTIGYGTKLPITKTEGEALLKSRMEIAQEILRDDWPQYDDQPQNVKAALWDMAYVLGPQGVQEFTHMLTALEQGNLEQAAAEVLNSEFAKQDPSRAKRIANTIYAPSSRMLNSWHAERRL